MNISYYTIDDMSLGPSRLFRKGWKLERFQTLEEALAHYRTLSATRNKMLGLTDGTHVLELVECLPIFPDDQEGEDVLASDHRAFPLWENEPEAARATDLCVSILHLRYIKDGDILVPIPSSDSLSKLLQDKYLWLNIAGDEMSAIRWVNVAGRGWVSLSVLKSITMPRPLVLKYWADGITEQGSYLSLRVEPWEYKLLLRRTLERREKNKNEGGTTV